MVDPSLRRVLPPTRSLGTVTVRIATVLQSPLALRDLAAMQGSNPPPIRAPHHRAPLYTQPRTLLKFAFRRAAVVETSALPGGNGGVYSYSPAPQQLQGITLVGSQQEIGNGATSHFNTGPSSYTYGGSYQQGSGPMNANFSTLDAPVPSVAGTPYPSQQGFVPTNGHHQLGPLLPVTGLRRMAQCSCSLNPPELQAGKYNMGEGSPAATSAAQQHARYQQAARDSKIMHNTINLRGTYFPSQKLLHFTRYVS